MSRDAFVLDTSAVLTLLEDEDGAARVETLLKEAAARKRTLFCSFVTRTEVGYIVEQERSLLNAEQALGMIGAWPVKWIESNEALCREAARLKATHKVSFADAFVAATALVLRATLVHKDPEFSAIKSISQEALPLKV